MGVVTCVRSDRLKFNDLKVGAQARIPNGLSALGVCSNEGCETAGALATSDLDGTTSLNLADGFAATGCTACASTITVVGLVLRRCRAMLVQTHPVLCEEYVSVLDEKEEVVVIASSPVGLACALGDVPPTEAGLAAAFTIGASSVTLTVQDVVGSSSCVVC